MLYSELVTVSQKRLTNHLLLVILAQKLFRLLKK